MLTYYLRIAWRSFWRHRWYSLINVACLAIGLAAVMTILLYLLHEHSYDRWQANSDRIFYVETRNSYGGSSWTEDRLSYGVGPAAARADPAVESMVRVWEAFEGVELTTKTGTRFKETSRFVYADSNFFQLFSFRLRSGNPQKVLSRPFTAVLTRSAAKRYFGNADPVGRTLIMDRQYLLEVTGVAEDLPSNSSLQFDVVASIATMSRDPKYQAYLNTQRLESGSYYTWLLLRKGADTSAVARNLSRMALVAAGKPDTSGIRSAFVESHRFSLMPLRKRHLAAFGGDNGRYLGAFTWVAVLILLLALINYMSLATARSVVRAREVGVRKMAGAERPKLAAQFYTESGLYAVFAFILGGALFGICKPGFCRLMQLPIDAGFLATPMVIGAFGLLLLLVILCVGSYPAFVLSSFRPAAVLYGRLSRERGGERIRKVFLVVQFALSMALMTCAFIVGKELCFMRHADTGVARENVMMVPFDITMENYAGYRAAVAQIPGIRAVATERFKLYSGSMLEGLAQAPGQLTPTALAFMVADSGLIPLLGLKWKEEPPAGGAWYGRDHLVLNEAAVDALQWNGRVTGRRFTFLHSTVQVAGVLHDFNFMSLHTPIRPLGIRITRVLDDEFRQGIPGVLYAKIAPHVNLPTLIGNVRRAYRRFDDRTPFGYTFLDDEFDSQYKSEDRLAALMDIFSGITVVIACLGLFALATFAAQQRRKEIGIRKVLGASVRSIGVLLSNDFFRPILLSVVIASPLAGWVMHRWLQDFAYRTPVSWWIFPTVGGGLMAIALLTVLVRTVRAAGANPVVNLRNE